MPYSQYPKIKIEYYYLARLTQLLGEIHTEALFIYDFKTHELAITDEIILKKVNELNIPHTEPYKTKD